MQTLVKLQSWWWRDILKVCKEGEGDGWFLNGIGWKVGSKDKVKLWEDVWVENSNLKTRFPKLFSLSLNQGHKVEEVSEWEDLEWRWSLRWRRARFEWESVLEAEFVILLSIANLIKDNNDVLVWRKDEAGGFSVNSAYEFLAKHGRGPQLDVFKYLWKAKVFPVW